MPGAKKKDSDYWKANPKYKDELLRTQKKLFQMMDSPSTTMSELAKGIEFHDKNYVRPSNSGTATGRSPGHQSWIDETVPLPQPKAPVEEEEIYLDPQELEVIRIAFRGFSVGELSKKMAIYPEEATNLLNGIYRKLLDS